MRSQVKSGSTPVDEALAPILLPFITTEHIPVVDTWTPLLPGGIRSRKLVLPLEGYPVRYIYCRVHIGPVIGPPMAPAKGLKEPVMPHSKNVLPLALLLIRYEKLPCAACVLSNVTLPPAALIDTAPD